MIEKLDDSQKMYKFKISLENADMKKISGSTIMFKAVGFKSWQARSTILIKRSNLISF